MILSSSIIGRIGFHYWIDMLSFDAILGHDILSGQYNHRDVYAGRGIRCPELQPCDKI